MLNHVLISPIACRETFFSLLATIAKYDCAISQVNFVVSGIVELFMNKENNANSVCADDWTAEWGIIASNEYL